MRRMVAQWLLDTVGVFPGVKVLYLTLVVTVA